jgi:hypothetical protein
MGETCSEKSFAIELAEAYKEAEAHTRRLVILRNELEACEQAVKESTARFQKMAEQARLTLQAPHVRAEGPRVKDELTVRAY